jgi:hypothetical protein
MYALSDSQGRQDDHHNWLGGIQMMIRFRKIGSWLAVGTLIASLLLPLSSAFAEATFSTEATATTAATPPPGLVDDLNDFTKVFQRSNLYTESANASYYGNDTKRAVRTTASNGYVVYKTSYDIQSFVAYSYFYTGVSIVGHKMYASPNGTTYTEVTPNVYTSGEPVSNWQLYAYEGLQLPTGTRYLKIEFSGAEKSWTPQLSKVVINQNTVSVMASPDTGVIGAEPLTVTLQSSTVGAAVYYKTNADTSFKVYTAPLSLTKFTKLDTYAQLDGLQPSPVRNYTYFARADMLVDKFGQVMSASFPTKVNSEQELRDDAAADQAYYGGLQPPAAFDEMGGLKGSKESLSLQARGFFNIQQANGKPLLVSPQGSAYFSLGVNGITNNETFTKVAGRENVYEWLPNYDSEYTGAFTGSKDNFSFYMANKYRKSGKMPSFNEFFSEAVDRIKKWGFNSAGAWGSGSQAKANNLPYTLVLPLNGMAKPAEIKVFDIFADGAEQAIVDAFSKTLPGLANDPLLIGYFVDNEYHYENFITTVPKLKASKTGLKKRLVQMLQDKYGDIATFNANWNTSYGSFADLNEAALYIDTQQASDDVDSFFRLYLDTYYETVQRLFKKYDPNHLLLGDRWLTLPMQSPKIRGMLAEEAGKFMDVISINHYSQNLDVTMLKDVYEKSGHKPILLSEWSYGTAEQGLAPIVPGSATNEQERQWRYRNYVEGAAALGFVVGTHWFDYVDQAATGRYFEGLSGEHYNTGLINVADRPYKTFLDGVMQTHRDIYDVLLGLKAPFHHDFGGSTGGGTAKDQKIDIPYTSTPIPIDGELNGYSGDAGSATLTVANRVSGTGGEEITANYHFAWDESNLYLTAYVQEPTPMKNNFQNGNIWKGDGIELFTGPGDLELGGNLQFSDRQLIMSSAIVNGTNYWMWFNTGRQPAITMNVKLTADGKGYVLDAAIPWTTINIDPSIGREFLFDFGFDDSEDGNNRKRQWEWNGTSKNNLDRGLWGQAKLVGAPDRTPPIITVGGVADGGDYTDTAIPVVTVEDAGSGVKRQSVKLDGLDWTAGTPVTAPGAHTLSVTAEDNAGNTASQDVHFAVYGSTSLTVQDAAGAYSDPVQLQATLLDQSGAPIAGETVTFRVDGQPAGSAQTDAAGRATAAYAIGVGVTDATYGRGAISAVFTPRSGVYMRGSSAVAQLSVSKEAAQLAYTGDRLGTEGGTIRLAAQVEQEQDGSLGSVAGLPVRFAIEAIGPNGSRSPVAAAGLEQPVATDDAGSAAAIVTLPAGLYVVRAELLDNAYYYASASAQADLAVRNAADAPASAKVDVSGFVRLTGDSLLGHAADKLHLDVKTDVSMGKDKWRMRVEPRGIDVSVAPIDWVIVSGYSAYLQGQVQIGAVTVTVRLLVSDPSGGHGQEVVSLQAWNGSDPAGTPIELWNAGFSGSVQVGR